MKVSKFLMLSAAAIGIFSMSSCQKEEDPVPVSASISRITVKQYPTTDAAGDLWDLTTNADIYVTMDAGTAANGTLYNSPTYINDAAGSGTYNFTQGLPVTITANTTHNISVWDLDDLDADDYVGGLTFVPADIYVSGTSGVYSLTGGGFIYEVAITWNF
jgi:hypothetical protein